MTYSTIPPTAQQHGLLHAHQILTRLERVAALHRVLRVHMTHSLQQPVTVGLSVVQTKGGVMGFVDQGCVVSTAGQAMVAMNIWAKRMAEVTGVHVIRGTLVWRVLRAHMATTALTYVIPQHASTSLARARVEVARRRRALHDLKRMDPTGAVHIGL
jgi:hypothetical protein